MLAGKTGVRFALALLLCAPRGLILEAQERPAVLESVDLLVPMAPQTVRIAGTTHVVYELHVTNFRPEEVAIARVQVTREGAPGVLLADYRDDELRRRIGRPGRRGLENPEVVAPGMRAVVYFWIPIPDGSQTPRALGHTLELEVRRPTGAVDAVVEGAFTRVSAEPAVILDPPLRGGPWVAISDPLLQGGHRTAIYTVGGRARIPARFAIDWIRLPAGGALDTGPGPRPPDWNGLGAEVLAVADGVVASAMDDIPDNPTSSGAAAPPIPLENASGNFVALDIGSGRFAFYEHLQSGSVAVKRGDRVRRGHVIGRLGNSGSSSIGPHLHFHVSDANSPLAAEGLPFVFRRFDHLGGFPSIEALIDGEKWVAQPAGEIARSLERPDANSVVRFP